MKFTETINALQREIATTTQVKTAGKKLLW